MFELSPGGREDQVLFLYPRHIKKINLHMKILEIRHQIFKHFS